MSSGLKKWFAQKWVDIGSKGKDGKFKPCGRSKQKADAKRKYPKCVPLAKARRMTEGQRKSAVRRKRAKKNFIRIATDFSAQEFLLEQVRGALVHRTT